MSAGKRTCERYERVEEENLVKGVKDLTPYVLKTSIAAAATSGLIFGYDIGILGVVTSMDSFLLKFFPSVCGKKNLDKFTNNYDSLMLTMFTLSLYLAALLSSLGAPTVTRRVGRICSTTLGGFLLYIGAMLSGFAEYVWMLILGRIVLGIGFGFVNQSMPMYLSEMAPYKYRGALNIGFQFAMTIGIFLTNWFTYVFAEIKTVPEWRMCLGAMWMPALVVMMGSFYVTDTLDYLNFLVVLGERDKTKGQLKIMFRGENIFLELNDLEFKGPEFNGPVAASDESQLSMATLIPKKFQQFIDINVIMFYAPVLFCFIGYKDNRSAVIIGLFNVFANLVSINGVDKWGRRALFLEGGIQILICQAVVAIAIALKFGID
ncbi:sugar carrier protein C-like [Lotus japonicus]|uniref:sugar carrier protein C-like n=1 Tax=Lotus japonicus TaxID=34305 RepID=UPI00258FECC5|nr:sugar carrier protein C-like [Lotus japonicus]